MGGGGLGVGGGGDGVGGGGDGVGGGGEGGGSVPPTRSASSRSSTRRNTASICACGHAGVISELV